MLRPFVLLEENKDPSEGGGGGGGGESAPFSADQLQALATLMNSTVTDHLKRKIPGAIADGFKQINFGEILAPELAKFKAPELSTGEKKPVDDFTKQMQEMSAKLEAAEQKSVALERARVEAESKRLHDSAISQFRNLLQPKLREDLLDVAVPYWATVEGRLKVSEDGTPTLRVRKPQFKGGPEIEEDMALTDAIPHLLASKEAKPFIPAPGVQQEKSGPAAKSKFVPSASIPSGDQTESAKVQSVLETFNKLGIDIGEVLG